MELDYDAISKKLLANFDLPEMRDEVFATIGMAAGIQARAAKGTDLTDEDHHLINVSSRYIDHLHRYFTDKEIDIMFDDFFERKGIK